MDTRLWWRMASASCLAAALVAVGAPTTGAQEPDPGGGLSTDPSAEEAAGRLDPAVLDAGSGLWQPSPRAALDEPDGIVVEDGVTQPVFSYRDAVRETVRIPGVISSQDGDELDVLTVDIIRPAASEGALRVPTIIVASPYYVAPGRGRAGEVKPPPGLPGTAADGAPGGGIDFFPLYYDNYFVPRGYAVALLDVAGTRASTGCLDIGGPAEIDNTARLVEWLHGSEGAVAYDLDGRVVAADWSNGLSAMIGKSWDGTVANGVASLGVDGLVTIVPIGAISSWHQYYWDNGVGYDESPLELANAIRNVPAERCDTVNAELAEGGADPDPTSDFWLGRNYLKDADRVQASVFVVHGLNDYNVKPHNYGRWWDALAAHDVPRKIWLSQVAHEKAFDFRRDEWLVTINRWLDHWLYEIPNGIMDEPMADVEHAPDQWATYDTWPGGTPTLLQLGQPSGAHDPRPGTLGTGRRNLGPRSQQFTETRQLPAAAVADGFARREDRLVFLTEELTTPVRLSGTASTVSLLASIDGPDATLTAYLVDYGTAERTNHAVRGGVLDLESITCFGSGTETDTGCYRDVKRRTHTQPFEVVARGWANASYITGEDTFDRRRRHRLEWDIVAADHVFGAGHRIGLVITGSDAETADLKDPGTASSITIHLPASHIRLPIVGGPPALRRAGTP
jgi:X-Pro dipeptidyl-peptidase